MIFNQFICTCIDSAVENTGDSRLSTTFIDRLIILSRQKLLLAPISLVRFLCAVDATVIFTVITYFGICSSFRLFRTFVRLFLLAFIILTQAVAPEHVDEDHEGDKLAYILDEFTPELDCTVLIIDFRVNFHEKAQITDALSDVNGSICDEKGNNHDQVEQGRLFVRMMGLLIDNEAAQQVN